LELAALEQHKIIRAATVEILRFTLLLAMVVVAAEVVGVLQLTG
jgi:hypothetical protein